MHLFGVISQHRGLSRRKGWEGTSPVLFHNAKHELCEGKGLCMEKDRVRETSGLLLVPGDTVEPLFHPAPSITGVSALESLWAFLNQNFHLLEKVFKLLFSKKDIFSGKVAFQKWQTGISAWKSPVGFTFFMKQGRKWQASASQQTESSLKTSFLSFLFKNRINLGILPH